MLKKKTLIPLIILTTLMLVQNCDSTEPPTPPIKSATITIEDNSLNEIWLKISTDKIQGFKQAFVNRDNETVSSFTFFNKDTVFIDKNLKPNKTFLYEVKIIDEENDTIGTQQINAKTIDTTSHNFNYTIWEFGEFPSSILYDVAIIDDNNIWAVGKINYLDSSGVNEEVVNALQWNGLIWDNKKIEYYGSCSAVRFPTLYTIKLVTDKNMVLTNSGSIGWFNGISVILDCAINELLDGAITSIWANFSNNIYTVGRKGSIVHYNGNVWTKIESGTDLTLTDIYGTSENEVYVSGTNTSTVEGIILKKDKLGNWGTFIESGIVNENELFTKLYGELDAIWIDERNTIYTGGNLLYRYKNNKWNYVTSLPENTISGNSGSIYRGFILAIRGNGSNDYVIAGDRNTLKHFNGSSWQQIGLPYDPSSPIIWHSLAQKDDIVVAVGTKGWKAIIILLTR